jgi:hypothetical protein
MKAIVGVAMLAAALVVSVVLAAEQQEGPAAASGTAAPEAAVPEVVVGLPPGQAPAPVPMVELTFEGGKTVTGRLIREDAQVVQITSLGGSSMGYPRALVQGVRRFSLSPADYSEQAGDFLAGQIWTAKEGSGVYVKAREQYQAALLLAAADQDRGRVQARVAALERERDALQAEALRQQDLQKARDEADLVRLQQKLTQEQLAAMQTFEPRLKQVEQGLNQTKLAIVALQDAANNISRTLDDQGRQLARMQDDLTILESNVVYVPYPVYTDPRRPNDGGSRGDGGRGDRGSDKDKDKGTPTP